MRQNCVSLYFLKWKTFLVVLSSIHVKYTQFSAGKEIELRDLTLGLPNNILHCKNWLSQTHFFLPILFGQNDKKIG